MRQPAQNEANILDKAQIEHSIGLIHDRHLDVPQIEYVLFEIIDDPARCADQHVDAFLEDAPLFFVIHAAEHYGELQAGEFSDGQCIGMDLDGEFTRRRDDDGARRIDRAVGRARVGQQAIEQRDEKGRCFTGAGLRLARNVATREGDRQRLRLNRRGSGKPLFGDTSLDGFGDIQGIKSKLTEMGV